MNITVAEFDFHLINFLIQEGYTHIWNTGITNPNPTSIATEDYLLIPLLPSDPRINYEEAQGKCLKINSLDVEDMAIGADAIRFIIQLPTDKYLKYLSKI
jgi:hypothetical protein